MSPFFKYLIDVAAAGIIALGIFLSKLIPVLAALAALSWYCIQIYSWWKEKKNAKCDKRTD
jgi:hypothetical protein